MKNLISILLITLLALMLIGGECGERPRLVIPTDTTEPSIVSQVVRSDEEGLLQHPGGASIFVPKGAVPLSLNRTVGEMLFTIETGSHDYFGVPDTPPAGSQFASGIFSMGPEGFIFENPIRVTLPISENVDLNENQVIMADYDPLTQNWMAYGGTVLNDVREYIADVMHLCFNILLTIPKDQAWGTVKLKSDPNYGFYACIVNYSLTYEPQFVEWVSVNNNVRVYPSDNEVIWALPQGDYTLQIGVYEPTTGQPLGYFERQVSISEAYVSPTWSTTEVELQTSSLTPGRPPCLQDPTPSVGVGALNVRLDWEASVDLDLLVYDPCDSLINYESDSSRCQGSLGMLDLDNACGNFVLGRPENIFWASNPPNGTYKIYVDYFGGCEYAGEVDYKVTWWLRGTANTKRGTIGPDDGTIMVTEFEY